MHPLDGPRLKVGRAVDHLNALRRLENAFFADEQYEVVRSEFNSQTGKYIYRVRANVVPGPDWGVYIGDIAHNLCSALDGLVYQLALLNPKVKAPAPNIQFPVFLRGRTSRTRLNRKGRPIQVKQFEGMELGNGRSMIRDLLPEHQAVIERLQPYKRGRGGKANPLYLLRKINFADKHRLVQVVGIRPFMYSWSNAADDADIRHLPYRVLEDGTKLVEAAPHVRVYPHVVPEIAFWKGCAPARNLPVTDTLHDISDHVSEIVEGFGPEFD